MTGGDLLRRAAERASQQPFYLASSLLAYARAERLDDAGLAAALGCDMANLPALLLCRRPTGEGPVFRGDVEAIAERFGINARRLAHVIRAADIVVSWAGAATDRNGGMLAAARDRERDQAQADGQDGQHASSQDEHPRPTTRPAAEDAP